MTGSEQVTVQVRNDLGMSPSNMGEIINQYLD